MRVVEVTWRDAWSSNEDYDKDHALSEHGPLVQTSLGYEIKSDEDGVLLAGCADDEGAFHRVMFIPFGMITQVRRLRG